MVTPLASSPPPHTCLLFLVFALPLLGLSVELTQQVSHRFRLSRKTRRLNAHKFHAVQHANVPSAEKRAFNPTALLLNTLLPLSLTMSLSSSLSFLLFFPFLILFFLFFYVLCLLFVYCSFSHQQFFILYFTIFCFLLYFLMPFS